MTEQPSTPRRSVVFSAMFLALAGVAFVASFHLFDGARLVGPLLDELKALVMGESAAPEPAAAEPAPAKLVLPPGMPQDFALRIWQEQLDSQPMIERLVNGDVKSLRIDEAAVSGDEAELKVTVIMKDGTSAPGTIGFSRFGKDWYVSHATGARKRVTGGDADTVGGGGPANSSLPSLEDVDVQLLSTILVEQRKSQDVIEEYLNGTVREVKIGSVQPGPRTVTMEAEMSETHGDAYARLVAIKTEKTQPAAWFLARFTRSGEETTTP